LAGAGAAATLLPGAANSAAGKYDALLLTCIDPRFPEHTLNYMRARGMAGKYSQVSLAGAAIAVVAPPFKDWRPAFWENLGASITLHAVPKVIVLDHRECGAAELAYGRDAVSSRDKENETHEQVFEKFRSAVKERHPKLAVETALMALDGSVRVFDD
jgi:carbonic anhydrase